MISGLFYLICGLLIFAGIAVGNATGNWVLASAATGLILIVWACVWIARFLRDIGDLMSSAKQNVYHMHNTISLHEKEHRDPTRPGRQEDEAPFFNAVNVRERMKQLERKSRNG